MRFAARESAIFGQPEVPWPGFAREGPCSSWAAPAAAARRTLPIRRVVDPADVAALAVHLMTNTAVTGATFDIDGGQQLVDA
jgi:NAD(P)-dependent dehydrogenase (short-subunit alcohol dehydrogenase family)